MSEWTDADRARAVAETEVTPEQSASLVTGALWAAGFSRCRDQFPQLWQAPAGDEEVEDFYLELWAQVEVLLLPEGDADLAAHIAATFPPEMEVTRDELIVQASFAVQELRMFWVDHAPRPETRRVDKAPGRNDPCPCGSGKKFKKCHGQAGAAA
jgi:uncharacterized protein